MTKKLQYVVKMMESERGWGKNYWQARFDSYMEAKDYINRVNDSNNSEYATSKSVPDWYMQPVDGKIIVEEIDV